MRYSDEELNDFASQIDIVDYIGQTEELQRKGPYYFTKCPFHTGDNTPSLCIYPDTDSWCCFGCGAGGKIYQWIQKKDNLNFVEAVNKVIQILGVGYHPVNDCSAVKFYKELKQDIGIKKQYIEQHIERPILDWQKDYCEKYVDELPEEWLNEDMTEEALRTYNIRIDKASNRIVYPVLDSAGKLIGVKGRTRLKDFKALKIQKYANYNKIVTIDYFQGWQQAFPAINSTKSVIIFEGIKSCIKAWGWGIKNTVAAETAKISDGQLQLLIKNGLREVIFGFDSDQSLVALRNDTKVQMLHRFTKVSAICDNHHLLGTKEAPVDRGKEVFEKLYNERIRI